MNTKQLLLIGFISILTACNLSNNEAKKVKYKSIVKDGTYKIMLPDFLDTTTALHKDASLQYANPYKELYVIVIHENKNHLKELMLTSEALRTIFPDSSSMMESYFTHMSKSLQEEPLFSIFDSAVTVIKKAKAKTASVTLMSEKEKVFYRIAAIEANKDIYQVYTWTLASSKEKYQPIMDSIINSLKEF